MKVPLVTLKSHVYAGKRRNPGDRYDATGQSDARLMKALGRAEPAPPESLKVAKPVKVAVSGVVWTAIRPESQLDDSVKPKRTYRRRDMTAEPDAE